MNTKTIDTITVQDFMNSPVWRFSEPGELFVEPVANPDCGVHDSWFFGTRFVYADKSTSWGMLSNIDLEHPVSTQQFMCISVEKSGEWFHLARYHDFDYNKRGPLQLAQFLGKSIEDVFPFSFDVREACHNTSQLLCGVVDVRVYEKLTSAEIIDLAINPR